MAVNLLKFLNPAPQIGALEISDLALKFLRIEDGKLIQAAVQLPPGVVVGGKVADKAKLISTLRGLHQQTHVILIIPSANVYIQPFSMPLVSEKNLKETAELNLQTISPIDIKTSYYGYEMVGETKQGQLEAIGAFANSQVVDDFVAALKEANFGVIAVESPGLALARLIKEYAANLKNDTPYLVINLSGDGPELMIMKNSHVYFDYFNSWNYIQQEVGGRKLTAQDVKDFLTRQVRQITNFYTAHTGTPINEALLVNNPIAQEVMKTLKENFALNAQILNVTKYSRISPIWYPVLGAAMRGLIPRSKDKFITLTALGVEEEYNRELALNFIKSWRNIIAVTMGFLFLTLLIADSYLVRISRSVAQDLAGRTLAPLSEIQELQNNARNFNQTADYALKAQELSVPWSPLLEKLRLLSGTRVTIERFFVDQNMLALVIGKAVNDSAVIAFKNTVEKEENFTDVVLPLSNIKVNPDGTVSFNLQFKISSLEF